MIEPDENEEEQMFEVRVHDAHDAYFLKNINREFDDKISRGEWAVYNMQWSPDSRWCTVFYSRMVQQAQIQQQTTTTRFS